MHIHVITLFPEMFTALTHFGVSGRAFKKKFCQLFFWNPRNYALDRRRTIDDRPYGGGPGMVMLPEPLESALLDAKSALKSFSLEAPVVYLSPQGKPLIHEKVVEFAKLPAVVFVCGRYEGIDQRFVDCCVDEEISIGDFVVSGGELPAMILIDSMIRQLPGVLGNKESLVKESFVKHLLDHPHYTKPLDYKGISVPEVLLGGDHQAIEEWRNQKAIELTKIRRPDLLNK